jgi:hypothetical protein
MNTAIRFSMRMALILALGTALNTYPADLGPLRISVAAAADWTEGVLLEIRGLDRRGEGSNHSRLNFDTLELVMDKGLVLKLDPNLKITGEGNEPMELEALPVQSRIRFRPRGGLVKEIILLDVLAR